VNSVTQFAMNWKAQYAGGPVDNPFDGTVILEADDLFEAARKLEAWARHGNIFVISIEMTDEPLPVAHASTECEGIYLRSE
jgi:hypothetical protein